MSKGIINLKRLRRLRLVRLLKGFSTEKLAELVYIVPSTLRNYECYNISLSLETKKRISKILDVQVKDFDKNITEEEANEYLNLKGRLNKKWRDVVENEFEPKKIALGLSKEHEMKKTLLFSRKPPEKQCLNQACLLNKECWCQSDQVRLGLASCDGQNKVKPKNEKGPATILFGRSY